ncbi:MAG: PASTA domain-containing protein [Eggerthellaceae bacterium]|nr:PASTA domain-containing protein [Eggerthellaceae bacterium]
MLCPNCETENRDGAKFCDECGFPLTGAIAARAAEIASSDTEEPSGIQPETDVTEAIDAVEVAGDEPTHDEEAQQGPSSDDETTDAEEGELPEDQAAAPDATAVIGSDLSGFDQIEGEYGERLVDPNYQNPQPNWRDGNTMQMPRIEGEEAPKSKDFLASTTTKQKRNGKTIAGIVIAIVAVVAIVAFATYQMQLWGGKAVPDVRGLTEADATSVLEESGFEVRSAQVKSDDTEGLVLITDPTAGARANEGDEIVIHIATARSVPNVIGKTEEEAKEAFEEEGYENVSYEKERSDSAEGTVLSVSPEAGTRAKSSISIIVKVAEAYTVPDTAGMSVDEAIAAVQDAGLPYDIAYVETQDYPEGTVLGTEPEANAKVKSDTVVSINVARARGVQLTQITKDVITPGYELTIDGTNYIVSSLDSASYLGGDQVSFTVTARPYTVFFGVYVEGDPQKVSGVITFTADNEVAGIS